MAIIDGDEQGGRRPSATTPSKKQWANFNVPPSEWKEGIFTAPHGVSYDKDGNLYVEDWNASGRVSRLNLVKGPKEQAKAD